MPTEMLIREERRASQAPPGRAAHRRADSARAGPAAEAQRRSVGSRDSRAHDALGAQSVERERCVRELRTRGRRRPVEPDALGAGRRYLGADRRDHGVAGALRAARDGSRGRPRGSIGSRIDPSAVGCGAFARARLERIGRVKFRLRRLVARRAHADAALGADRVAGQRPLRAVEQQQHPGDWDPRWILVVGGVWALVVAIFAVRVAFERPTTEAEIDRELERIISRR